MVLYTTNLPVSSNPPRVDQPGMTANTQYLQAFGNKDHNFSQDSSGTTDGYHTVAHFTNAPSNPPSATSGYAQLYGFGGQLWFQNATGFGPLTGPTVINTNGSVLIGGIRINWGQASAVWSGGPTITFSVPFSGVPYSIVPSLYDIGNVGPQEFINVNSPLAGSWTPKVYNRQGSISGTAWRLMYVAIGPA